MKTLKIAAIMMAGSFMFQAQASRAIFAQQQNLHRVVITSRGADIQANAPDFALLIRAYGKLAKFIKAGNARTTSGGQNRKQIEADDIRFEIWNVHTGPVEEIYDRPYGQLVTKPSGNILQIVPGTVSRNGRPARVLYQAAWAANELPEVPTEDWDKITVRKVLAGMEKEMPPAKTYTSYEVRIQFKGQARSYAAVAFHHKALSDSDAPIISFTDNIVGQSALTRAYLETLPAVE